MQPGIPNLDGGPKRVSESQASSPGDCMFQKELNLSRTERKRNITTVFLSTGTCSLGIVKQCKAEITGLTQQQSVGYIAKGKSAHARLGSEKQALIM